MRYLVQTLQLSAVDLRQQAGAVPLDGQLELVLRLRDGVDFKLVESWVKTGVGISDPVRTRTAFDFLFVLKAEPILFAPPHFHRAFFLLFFFPTTQAQAMGKLHSLHMDDKVVLGTGPYADLRRIYATSPPRLLKYLSVQQQGTLKREAYCRSLVHWLLRLCSVSEGFSLTMANIWCEKLPLASPQTPEWMQQLFLSKCLATSAMLRHERAILPLWSLMTTDGYITKTLRMDLRKLYITLLGLPQFKDEFAVTYASIYPVVADDICSGVRGRTICPGEGNYCPVSLVRHLFGFDLILK